MFELLQIRIPAKLPIAAKKHFLAAMGNLAGIQLCNNSNI